MSTAKKKAAKSAKSAAGRLKKSATRGAAKKTARATHGAVKRGPTVLVATRKGAWLFHGDAARRNWRIDGPHFLGQIIQHAVLDPRDGRTLLAAAKTGHLGPTVFRSTDLGKKFKFCHGAS